VEWIDVLAVRRRGAFARERLHRRHQHLTEEPLRVFGRLPDGEYAKDVVGRETGRLQNQALRWTPIPQAGGEGVVVCRAAIAGLDVELQDGCDWQLGSSRSGLEAYDPDDQARAA
jgi:hypothetical protein